MLANPATATDTDYGNIESVVAHEYFHNWTGNRVTCRDWFTAVAEGRPDGVPRPGVQPGHGWQPSARAVKRIEDVRVLRPPSSRGRRPHGAPGAPDSYGDQQLLHRHHLRRVPRSSA